MPDRERTGVVKDTIRDALERAKAAIYDAHYGNGIEIGYVHSVDKAITEAMAEHAAQLKVIRDQENELVTLRADDGAGEEKQRPVRCLFHLVKGDKPCGNCLACDNDSLRARLREVERRLKAVYQTRDDMDETIKMLRAELGRRPDPAP